MESVYSAVRTGSLNKAVCASSYRVKEAAGSSEMSSAQAYCVVSHPKKDKNISRCPSCEYHSTNFIAFFGSIPQAMQFSKVHFPAVNYFSKSLSSVPCVYLMVLLCASKITAPEVKSFFRWKEKEIVVSTQTLMTLGELLICCFRTSR